MTEKRKSGRPKKEPTKVLSFRVPVKYAEKLNLLIQQLLKKEIN